MAVIPVMAWAGIEDDGIMAVIPVMAWAGIEDDVVLAYSTVIPVVLNGYRHSSSVEWLPSFQ